MYTDVLINKLLRFYGAAIAKYLFPTYFRINQLGSLWMRLNMSSMKLQLRPSPTSCLATFLIIKVWWRSRMGRPGVWSANSKAGLKVCMTRAVTPSWKSRSLELRRQGVLRGPTLESDFLCLLDARKQELPANFYCIKKIVLSQSYDLSKLGLCLYLQYAHKF